MDKKALIKALRDTVQSASNTVASGVSAPVDLIAAGLRKVGLPIPQAPVGGSQWMENMGLTIPVEDGIPKLAGETLGMIVPMAATAKAPQIAAAANRGLENLAAPRTLNTPGYGGQRGAIVWHGSPHKFDAFDASKIGTGEGAQAYGHGLYFAESPDVAKSYQQALTIGDRYVDNKLLDYSDPRHLLASILADAKGSSNPTTEALDALQNMAMPGGSKSVRETASKALELFNKGERPVAQYIKPEGALYKVDLPDEAIARMLDWDKPLSQQPHVMDLINKQESARTQSVLDQRLQTLANVGEDAPNAATLKRQIELLREEVANPQSGVGSMTGGKYYNYLLRRDMPPAEQADMFRGAGIPGIRYLDQGSRGAGAGTSNFVVFPGEERLLRILERNNQPMGLMGVK